MRMNEMEMGGIRAVEGYGPGFFRIGGTVHEGAVLATVDRVLRWGGLDDREAVLALADEVDVIFFGMGAEIAHLPEEFRAEIEALGMGAEVMNSPAACRTWNLLVAEGRRVALAVLPV